MNILGIGPLELLILAVIALIVLGPKGLADLGLKTGRLIRRITRSPMWDDVMATSREINELPRKIMHDIDMEEEVKELRSTAGTPVRGSQHDSPATSPDPDTKGNQDA